MFATNYKFQVSKSFNIVYMLLLLLGLFLTIGRWASQFSDFVIINSEINSHISNFSLSLMAYLGIGFIWMLSGVKFNYITVLGLVFIAGNLFCETLMTILNTPDIVDAYFGIFGTSISYLFLFVTQKYGLAPVKNQK